ncbi:MAG: tetratricopeptide repeat protein, partial [Bacteroidota bacterium]
KYELENYLEEHVWAESDESQRPVVRGLTRARLHRVDPENYDRPKSPAPVGDQITATQLTPDTSYIDLFKHFNVAIRNKHLMFPKDGSAYQIYQRMGNAPEAQRLKSRMKIILGTKLQDLPQKALNDYITSPASELKKRFTAKDDYQYYPDYLALAIKLQGEDNPLSKPLKSKHHYFKGLNYRLEAEEQANKDELYNLGLAEQNKALDFDPEGSHIYNEIGIIYRELQNPSEAEANFLTANALSPKWSLPLNNLAITYKEMDGMMEEAVEKYQEAIDLDTTLALPYYNLAKLYDDKGSYDQAIPIYLKSISLDDSYADAFYNLGRIYAITNQPVEETEKLLDRYYELDAAGAYDYLAMKAYLYNKNQLYEKAIEVNQAIYDLDNSEVTRLRTIGFYEKELGHLEKAESAFDAYIQLVPEDKMAFLGRSESLVLQGKDKQALKDLSQALELDTELWNIIAEEPSFEGLKGDKVFEKLRMQYEKN